MASKNLMQMLIDIVKLDRFDGGSFKRWQKKMHFLLATLNVEYVLTKPYPKESENETLAESHRETSHVQNVISLSWPHPQCYVGSTLHCIAELPNGHGNSGT
ncbi:hypothetical protein Tco_0681602 [Tanacetum coccineum]|uniref:Zinc finger, CCHC-type n=1 Tax=Tanacetum coccineum TaxID=301880 RepID=A0ABQ4XQ46_9ASTR